MSAYDAKTRTAFSGYDLPEATNTMNPLRRLYVRVAGWSQKRRDYHRTLRDLNALSDHELTDIGITRSDIPAIARGTARSQLANG